jgi:hypothetical protein
MTLLASTSPFIKRQRMFVLLEEASTKSDGDNCVEPGEGECIDTRNKPCEHTTTEERRLPTTKKCEVEIGDLEGNKGVYKVGDTVEISPGSPEKKPGKTTVEVIHQTPLEGGNQSSRRTI